MGDSISAVFAGAAIGLLCFLWPHVAALRKRITRVEGKLDLLLKEAGLHRVTISLDSLRKSRFFEITRSQEFEQY